SELRADVRHPQPAGEDGSAGCADAGGRLSAGRVYQPATLPERRGVRSPGWEECLWHHRFTSRDEAFLVIAAWLEKYHTERPHSALGYLTPREFAEQVHRARPRAGLRLRGIYRPSSRRRREGASRAPPSSVLGVLHEVQIACG